jgi:hypothetical protein
MSQYFAQLDDNNVVTHVAVVTADFMADNPDRYPGRWVETFFDTAGKTYAGVGYIYNEDTEAVEAPVVPELPTDPE